MSDSSSRYSPAVAELLREERLAPLGPGTPNESVRTQLASLTDEALFAPHPVRDPKMAAACRAGLWLYHDFLDESHTISQDIDTPTGSYWHGLMHRREPDFDNSRYWFRRVGAHPIFEILLTAAADLARDEANPAAKFLVSQGRWDPFAFVDLCAAVVHGSARCEMLCRRFQQSEWHHLFDYCWNKAIGRTQA